MKPQNVTVPIYIVGVFRIRNPRGTRQARVGMDKNGETVHCSFYSFQSASICCSINLCSYTKICILHQIILSCLQYWDICPWYFVFTPGNSIAFLPSFLKHFQYLTLCIFYRNNWDSETHTEFIRS